MTDITIPYRKRLENLEKKRIYDKRYRENNREKMVKKAKQYYSQTRRAQFEKNPSKYLWMVARSRARKFHTEFDITPSDIFIPKFCPITGDKLEKTGGYIPNAMSLDRVNNDLGYIKGNVRVISRWANLKKSSLSIQHLEKLLKYMRGEI